jgi:hypothetical protein
MSRPLGRVIGVGICVTLALSFPSPATATGEDDGLWYFEASGMEQIHESARGAGVTIAVLDSQINTDVPDLAGVDLEVHEPSYCAATEGGAAVSAASVAPEADHGTAVASMIVGTGAGIGGQPGIVGIAPDATVRFYSVGVGTADSIRLDCAVPAGTDVSRERPETTALRDAIADGADIISVSNGIVFDTSAIAEAQRDGVIIVASAGNFGGSTFSPLGASNGVVSVGSVTPDLAIWTNNPAGPELAVNAPGVGIRVVNPEYTGYTRSDGSSLATPYTAGVLALAWSTYPNANANQMIQALLRTTGGETHELLRDDVRGYGLVNARALLAIDPTTLPDENPLLTDGPDREPTRAEVLGTATDEPSATPSTAPTSTPQPTATPSEQESAASGPPIGLIGGGIALVAVLLVLTVVLLRRRPSDSDQSHVTGDHHGHQG